jgi:hypothetical protein
LSAANVRNRRDARDSLADIAIDIVPERDQQRVGVDLGLREGALAGAEKIETHTAGKIGPWLRQGSDVPQLERAIIAGGCERVAIT